MTGTSCSCPCSNDDEDSPELTHIRSAYRRRQGVNRATSARSTSETAAAMLKLLRVRSNLGSFVDPLFRDHHGSDHTERSTTTRWGRAGAAQAPCGKILTKISDKSPT